MTTSFACKSTTCLSPTTWAISNFLFLSKKRLQEWSCVCQCCSYVLYFCLIFSIKNVHWDVAVGTFSSSVPHIYPHKLQNLVHLLLTLLQYRKYTVTQMECVHAVHHNILHHICDKINEKKDFIDF